VVPGRGPVSPSASKRRCRTPAGDVGTGRDRQQAGGGGLGRFAPVAVAAHAVEDGQAHVTGWPARDLHAPRRAVGQPGAIAERVDEDAVVLVLGAQQHRRPGADAAARRDVEAGAEIESVEHAACPVQAKGLIEWPRGPLEAVHGMVCSGFGIAPHPSC